MDTSHFTLEDIRTTLKLMSKDCYMCTVDIKDAYFFIDITEHYWKYLRFQYESISYEYSSLHFGLLMKPIMQHLRRRGFLLVNHLDDLLLIGKTVPNVERI